jgi:hypothetical protein
MINLFEEIKKKQNAEKVVEDILEKEPITRTSDNILFIRYYQLLNPPTDFLTYFKSPEKFKGFSYKTIERARRKIQARRPELKDRKIAELRYDQEQVYFEYGRA